MVHLLEALLFWWPLWRLNTLFLFGAAILSWWTVVVLIPAIPNALVLRSPSELEREIYVRTAALQASENRFRTMADAAPVLIWLAGTDTKCTYFNKPWLAFRGRTLLEERGNGWTEGIHPDDYKECMEIYQDAFNARRAFEVKFRFLRNDGEYRWVLNRGVPLLDAAEEFSGFIGSAVDITGEQLLAEELARQSEERGKLAAIVESSEDSILSKDISGTILSWNKGAERLFGYTADWIMGRNVSILFPSGTKEDLMEIFARLQEGERIDPYDTVRIRQDGSRVEISLSLSPVRDENGTVIGASSVARDITEKKQAERALAESQSRFRRLADSNLLGIAFWMLDGVVYEANDAFLRMFGYDREDMEMGKLNLGNITAPESLKLFKAGFEKAMSGEFVEPYEARYHHKDGHEVSALTGYAMLEGSHEKGVVFSLDTTQEKLYQKSREMFLATLTHDLKTPIFGNERVLLLMSEGHFGGLSDVQKSVVQELLTSNRFMARLVDNMLSTHLFEKGLQKLHKEVTDLNELVRQNLDLYEGLATDKKQKLVLKLDEQLPKVEADPFEIQRVLNNLIDNAMTHTPPGGEVVLCTAADAGYVEVSVKDTGLGMEPEEQREVFEQYKRYQKKFKHVGVGLGLYLSRLIIEEHGGVIDVESMKGKGSRFYFRLKRVS